MAKPRHQKNYAHDILHAVSRHRDNVKSNPHPIDQGEVTAVGDDDEDIRIKLFNQEVTLEGDECSFLIDEEFLKVGDVVAVGYDESGDPIVLAVGFQDSPYVVSTGPVNVNPTGLHMHKSKTFTPGAPQSQFTLPKRFDSEAVYVDGLRKVRGFGYNVSGRTVTLTTPAPGGSIVHIDYQIDL